MKRHAITLLIAATPILVRALTPQEFRETVSEMENLPQARADSVANSLMGSPEALGEVSDMAREILFDPESTDFNERIYSSFARAEANSDFATPTQRALAEWEVYAIELNAIGTKANDFEVKTTDGQVSTMSQIAAGEPMMLYFYNPDCRHCEQTLKRIHDKAMPAKVLAVCIDSTEKRWMETKSALPEDWIPVFDMSDVQAEDLYIFIATPSIYLIDSNGLVTAKNPPITSLINEP